MNSRIEHLNGWKEIADHLGRSVRCVRRWGKNEEEQEVHRRACTEGR